MLKRLRTPGAPVTVVMKLLLCSVALANPSFEPVFNPALETARAVDAIKIDGMVDETAWSAASHVANFVERDPGDNSRPLVETEAFITYDEDNLYVAFVCSDDPADIRATMCERDQFEGDDAVGLLIDTFGEATWAYEFFVNPYGIQTDRMWTNVRGADDSFDMIWQSAAQITETGYTVEMALPFASMRFPSKDVQSWKVDFWRIHPRDSYRRYSWSAKDRDEQCWPCQWGTVDGIAGVQPGRGFELLPAFVSSQSGAYIVDSASARFENRDILGEPSLGAKYSLSSDVTLEATLNPDFSQIEADAGQMDVNSTIALFYPERRPFFQEGSDLFRTLFNSFYTRTVNDPDLAAKGTARWDKTSLVYLIARDENSPYIIPTREGSADATPGKSTVNVVRGLHSIGNNSQVGFMATDRRYDVGGSGTILTADANLRLSRSWSWVGQFVYSHTEEPTDVAVPYLDYGFAPTFDYGKHTVALDGETYSGTAFVTELRLWSRNLVWTVDYNQLTPTYQTQTGYDPWNDQKNLFSYGRYIFRFDNGLIETVTPGFFVDRRWNWDVTRKWAHFTGGVEMQFRWAQTYFNANYQTGSEVWSGIEFQDLWNSNIDLVSRPTDWLGYNAHLRLGEGVAHRFLVTGDEINASAGLDLKPTDRLILEPSIQYARSTDAESGVELFKQTIFRNRLRFQLNPKLSTRLVVQYNNFTERWEVDPLLTYRLSSFSVFYLGSTYDYDKYLNATTGGVDRMLSSRQFFMKIQYLFQT